MNDWIREFHRWISLTFTVAVISVFVVPVFAEPAEWVFYLPLPPLLLLLATGLYLFALPYVLRAQGRRMGKSE